MDFAWTEDQQALNKQLSDFARAECNRDLVERDRQCAFSRETWTKCAQIGVHGLAVPTEYGGTGLDPLSALYAMEGLGYGCRDNGLLFAIAAQMWSVQAPILRFGSDAQKSKYLPALVSGACIGAHGMTEPESGSDSFALATRAEKQDGGYLLNGAKTFITNAPFAELFLVFATVNKKRGFFGITAFLIDKGTPGLQVSRPIEMMGLRTTSMGEVSLQDCFVDASCRLGPEGGAASIFRHSMAWERGAILASCVGTMQRQIEVCTSYANARKQFDTQIGKFQSVANRLVDMKVRLEAGRLLLYRWAWKRGQGIDDEIDSAMVKLFLSESFVASSLDAILVHGGYGYSTELEVERDLRDAIASQIYSGTTDIQRTVIARGMGL
jgi:hypothetical protein